MTNSSGEPLSQGYLKTVSYTHLDVYKRQGSSIYFIYSRPCVCKKEFCKMVKAIVGANWGDEGKGKITDVLANEDVYKRQP